MMQIIETLILAIFTAAIPAIIFALVFGFMLMRRLRADVQEKVRVIFPGGTEREYRAYMIAEKLAFDQETNEGTEEREIELVDGDTPDRKLHWGLPQHIYYNIEGQNKTVIPPWRRQRDPYQIVANTKEEALGVKEQVDKIWDEREKQQKDRYSRRLNALNAFKQLVSGLTGMNKWQAIALIALGFFMGMTVAGLIPPAGAG